MDLRGSENRIGKFKIISGFTEMKIWCFKDNVDYGEEEESQ